MNNPGIFITLEGTDGCGKSTQARLLCDYLSGLGYEVILTREPGGTPLAEEIRKVILTPSSESLDEMAEILLYTASRAQHLNHLIKPALAMGKVVICERFIDSSIAYQGYGLGLDLTTIREINQIAVGNFEPCLTILLDMETSLCQDRILSRTGSGSAGKDRIESRNFQFHEKVRRGYREIAKNNSRIVLIDVSTKSITEIHHVIIEILTERLGVIES